MASKYSLRHWHDSDVLVRICSLKSMMRAIIAVSKTKAQPNRLGFVRVATSATTLQCWRACVNVLPNRLRNLGKLRAMNGVPDPIKNGDQARWESSIEAPPTI